MKTDAELRKVQTLFRKAHGHLPGFDGVGIGKNEAGELVLSVYILDDQVSSTPLPESFEGMDVIIEPCTPIIPQMR